MRFQPSLSILFCKWLIKLFLDKKSSSSKNGLRENLDDCKVNFSEYISKALVIYPLVANSFAVDSSAKWLIKISFEKKTVFSRYSIGGNLKDCKANFSTYLP